MIDAFTYHIYWLGAGGNYKKIRSLLIDSESIQRDGREYTVLFPSACVVADVCAQESERTKIETPGRDGRGRQTVRLNSALRCTSTSLARELLRLKYGSANREGLTVLER